MRCGIGAAVISVARDQASLIFRAKLPDRLVQTSMACLMLKKAKRPGITEPLR